MIQALQLIGGGVFMALLALTVAMQPIRPSVSRFELQRRARVRKRSEQDKLDLTRSDHAAVVEVLLQFFGALLSVGIAMVSVSYFGWGQGFFVALAAVVGCFLLGCPAPVRLLGATLYKKIENRLLKIARLLAPILRVDHTERTPDVSSKEEIAYTVNRIDSALLSHSEKELLLHALEFSSLRVADSMVPRQDIDVVEASELLGPLTLDTLHKTKRSHLPVVEGSIDHVVGVLHLHELLIVSSKKTHTAAEAMEPTVCYVREDYTLQQALAVALQTHHHLLVVVDDRAHVVGLLSLGDIIAQLFGYIPQIAQHTHDSKELVAAREPKNA